MLGNADFSLAFELHLDASGVHCSEEIPNEEVQAILKGCLEEPQFIWEAYACSVRVTEDLRDHLKPSIMGNKEWKAAQLRDPTISTIYKMVVNKTLSHRRSKCRDDPEVKSYLYQKSRLKLRNGVLYRHIDNNQRPDRNNIQICYPRNIGKKFWRVVMIMLDTLDWIGLLTYSETDSTGPTC